MSAHDRRDRATASAGGDAAGIELSADQRRAVARLSSRADRHLDALTAIANQRLNVASECPAHAQPSRGYERLKTPRQSNCVGIFGRRGSGKTTVMLEVLQHIHRMRPGWYTLVKPMDLSYAPHEFPHGLTVIHWLYEELRKRLGERSTDMAAHKAFERMARSYFRGSDGFNALVRDLAVSAESYAHAAASEISLRLSLRNEVQRWLDAQAKAMDVDGFVIAVDDIDLTPANRHQSLIWSLLDELHQDRLLFVLAADLERMEQRLAEEDQFARHDGASEARRDASGSQQAARDLAYKVLPQVDRAELMAWEPKARLEFPPEVTTDAATKRMSKQAKAEAKAKNTIGALVDALTLPAVLRLHLSHLLPGWARGLENVQRELLQLRSDREAAEDAESTGEAFDGQRMARDLMVSLAESSFDFDLARKLRERPLEDWAPTFSWKAPSASLSATWEVLRLRLRAGEDLPELLPDTDTCPLKISLERARWAEVLLDLAMAERRLTPVRLVHRLPWLQARWSACEADLQRNAEPVARAVEDDPAGMLAALYWLRWDDRGESGIRFALGWWPLLQWLGGDRPLWPSSARAELWTPESLGGAAMSASPRARPAARASTMPTVAGCVPALLRGQRVGADVPLLPARVRESLRLADTLAGLPWASLASVQLDVGPPGLARLAAALSYHGLRSLLSDPDRLGRRLPAADWLAPLVRPLQRDAAQGDEPADTRSPVNALDDETIRARFKAVVREADADRRALQEHRDDPLAVALLALLDAPWFRGLAV
jgi:hypothetical protein